MIDRDKHIGKRMARLSLVRMGDPFARGVLADGVDAEQLQAALQKAFRAIFDRVDFVDFEWPLDEFPQIEIGVREIKSREDERKAWETARESLGDAYEKQRQIRSQTIANNQDNGKYGVWRVEGIRHTGHAYASSAAEAIEKCLAAGVVGDWESPDATYLGEKPEVF